MTVTAACPWCHALRRDGTTCPECGAIYAKAEQIRKHGRVVVNQPLPVVQETIKDADLKALYGIDVATLFPDSARREPVKDRVLELKFCILAIPAMLLLGMFFTWLSPGLQRTMFTMPLHELGHATVAWLTGYLAVPLPWVTLTASARSPFAPIACLGGAAYLIYRGHAEGHRFLFVLGVVIALLTVMGTFLISEATSRMLITFCGDAGGMIFGTLLMMSFFFGKQTKLYHGNLRWGFAAIGASAFVNIFSVWMHAARDRTMIPFGVTESLMPSDALKLTTMFGWSETALVQRYLAVGVVCLLALAAVYAWGVHQARLAARQDS